jgi:hypothetical protein
MPDQDIVGIYKEDLQQLRAVVFMGRMALQARIAEDYQARPSLLTADLAWAVMTALCAAEVAGVELDLNAAVEAGRALYESEGFPKRKGADAPTAAG